MAAQDGDVLRVDAIGDFNNTELLTNSFQLEVASGGPIDDADLLDDLSDFFETLYGVWKAIYSALVTYRRIRVQNLTQDVIVGDQDFAAEQTGTSAQQTCPSQVCAVLNLKTAVPRVVMRKFIGPQAENHISDQGVMTSAVVTALASGGDLLVATIIETNGSYNYGYLSPKTQTFLRPVGYVVSTIPATQRRRRIGTGA